MMVLEMILNISRNLQNIFEIQDFSDICFISFLLEMIKVNLLVLKRTFRWKLPQQNQVEPFSSRFYSVVLFKSVRKYSLPVNMKENYELINTKGISFMIPDHMVDKKEKSEIRKKLQWVTYTLK